MGTRKDLCWAELMFVNIVVMQNPEGRKYKAGKTRIVTQSNPEGHPEGSAAKKRQRLRQTWPSLPNKNLSQSQRRPNVIANSKNP